VEVSVLDARNLIAVKAKRQKTVEPVEVSVLEARDAIVIELKRPKIAELLEGSKPR
jgi:hypothetical protein